MDSSEDSRSIQMFIGDGAKLVRDAFELAKEKAPAIIFIDELDAIGTKRFDSDKAGDREVQRTMLELLNQLDGFSSDVRIKVSAICPLRLYPSGKKHERVPSWTRGRSFLPCFLPMR
jgi:ATP-dependent 26S proteasome regulatory subunit